ncbi:MAG: hypothetical protein WD749_10765 [Phycisphaerales bacterium]
MSTPGPFEAIGSGHHPPPLADHRGRPARLVSPAAASGASPGLKELLATDLYYLSPIGAVASTVGLSLAALAVLVFSGASRGLLVTGSVVFAAAAPLLIARKIAFRRGRLRAVLRRCLSEGLCPACGYSLRGVPDQPDGCRVCPECGAAWRLP